MAPQGESAPFPDTRWVRALGLAGLIPFVFLASLLWLVDATLQSWAALALATYAALIASFLGGVHWGIGWIATDLRHARLGHFLWGVTPSLLAWPGLLIPPYAGLVSLGLLLVLCYIVDRHFYRRAGLTRWLGLRLQLTIVASLSCFLGASAL
ncbi:DUF3429 domain-containing protein [Hydrogenophaga sp.]|uniref:DUF3429 domain-containing protein n=1 Tax=Hydrogenophaga sp. TaxID=1904254 RepID=UPI0027236FDD|nr:DUF3429 domain-containing protein [Hydrogenophaga sp.]MDO8904193.1 DUF3429 domain-containing protein [Hydrogenophaga sp.]